MLSLTRWTPWTELAGLHRDLDSMFSRAFGENGARPTADPSLTSFTPAAEVWRDGDTWLVLLALPGIAPDSVEIDVVGQTLRVRGERVQERKADTQPILCEISYGRFEREFTLPEEIEAKNVKATYRQGMLELALPLSEGARPHRITVYAQPDAKALVTA